LAGVTAPLSTACAIRSGLACGLSFGFARGLSCGFGAGRGARAGGPASGAPSSLRAVIPSSSVPSAPSALRNPATAGSASSTKVSDSCTRIAPIADLSRLPARHISGSSQRASARSFAPTDSANHVLGPKGARSRAGGAASGALRSSGAETRDR
jgi:hypothetical protein